MTDLAHSEARYLALLYRQMMKLLDRELAPLDLGHGRYLYLFSLYLHSGRTQQELADRLGADKAAAARALSRLEADGYVRREPDVRDRRAVRVFLTPKGLRLKPRLEQAARRSTDSFTRTLSESERAEFRRLLALIAAPYVQGPDPDRT